MDTYYIKALGKRKTYLVIISFIHFIMLFAVSFYINDWVEEENIGTITLFAFIFNFIGIFKVAA